MTERPSLSVCDREPIHIPGSIQPHGMLVAVARDGTVAATSANADPLLAIEPRSAIGRPLADAAPALQILVARLFGDGVPPSPIVRPGPPVGGATSTTMTCHGSGGLLVIEVEPDGEPSARRDTDSLSAVEALIDDLDPGIDDGDAFHALAATVRTITGFDRVLVYSFDDDHVGTVVGEDGNGVLPSYLGLRFPASDIPAQARALYRINRLRQIPDAGYRPVPILTRLGSAPIDLSHSVLRSVAPVHLEYMRNMGTGASMSVSILVGGRLWGLVSCHNSAPKWVPPSARRTADLVTQMLALRIAAHGRERDAADRLALQGAISRLLKEMADRPHFSEGLRSSGADLMAATRSAGAALVEGNEIHGFGDVPDDADIRRIVAWLDERGDEEVTATDRLPSLLPILAGAADRASGLIAVALSRLHSTWLLWFRPEVVRTVTWGGDPRKQFEPIGPETRISPRKSFDAWAETVRGTSAPWTAAEVEAARELRSAIVDIVLKKAEEVAAVSEDLRRSNKELEAFSYSISHDLRAPFRHIVGYAELLSERQEANLDEKSRHYLRTIIEAAHGAGKLVDDLLNFSQLGRVTVQHVGVDMNKLVVEVCRSLQFETRDRSIEWTIGTLPSTLGDPSLLRQVFFNLIANAVKYTRGTAAATIEIGGWAGDTETTYYVRDNGIGFDMAYSDKLFQVFQRLNRTEDFEGTGIGLALVRRVVERHGGRTWAAGQVGRGATFYFALPSQRDPAKPDGRDLRSTSVSAT